MNFSYNTFVQLCNRFIRNQKTATVHLTCKFNITNIQQWSKYSSQAIITKSRQPTTLKLDIAEFQATFTPEMKKLITTFEQNNQELRIVGGAVRDLLMKKQPLDIDFASPATPDQMKKMFNLESFVTFKDKGETHGTVSVRIDEKENFEISTLRIFLVKNGQRSKLEYTKDWYLDASRRDLTINSMFLGFDGIVYDYFNGIKDLEMRRIRFVDNAADRIREDYLRIFRYFRFYGMIAKNANNHDSQILQAIKDNVDGLYAISRERIWPEVKKILSGNFKFDLMKTMLEVDLAPFIGLSKDVNIRELEILNEKAARFSLHPVTIIASLLKNDADMAAFNEKMRLSNYEKELGYFIIHHREDKLNKNLLQQYKESLILWTHNKIHLREWIEQVLSYRGEGELLNEFKNWQMPTFPVKGHQLFDKGIPHGKRMGYISMAMKKRWLKSSFTLTDKDLLSSFDEIVQEVNEQLPPKKEKQKNKGNNVNLT